MCGLNWRRAIDQLSGPVRIEHTRTDGSQLNVSWCIELYCRAALFPTKEITQYVRAGLLHHIETF